MATNYIDTFDREKEIALMDKLAAHQVVITKRRRACSLARSNLAAAKREERAIKTEIFVNRMGVAEYQRRQNGAKKAGLAHTARAQQRKVERTANLQALAEAGVFAPDIEGTGGRTSVPPMSAPPVRTIAEAITILEAKPERSPVTPAVIEATHAAAVQAAQPVDASGYNDNGTRRCNSCRTPITQRGLCACAGVRHRQFRTITAGPTMNIKHAPVLPFQMEGKIE